MEWRLPCTGTGRYPDAPAVHARYRTLQDFARGLAGQMHCSLVLSLLEHVAGGPPLLSLALGGSEQGWHVACGTAEEVAHQLHALGMHYWATRRRHHRQAQAEDARGYAREMPHGGKGLTRPAKRATLSSMRDGYIHQL
jgi:hypothetical protein